MCLFESIFFAEESTGYWNTVGCGHFAEKLVAALSVFAFKHDDSGMLGGDVDWANVGSADVLGHRRDAQGPEGSGHGGHVAGFGLQVNTVLLVNVMEIEHIVESSAFVVDNVFDFPDPPLGFVIRNVSVSCVVKFFVSPDKLSLPLFWCLTRSWLLSIGDAYDDEKHVLQHDGPVWT